MLAALQLPLPGIDPDAELTKSLEAKVPAATGPNEATREYHVTFRNVMKLVIVPAS